MGPKPMPDRIPYHRDASEDWEREADAAAKARAGLRLNTARNRRASDDLMLMGSAFVWTFIGLSAGFTLLAAIYALGRGLSWLLGVVL